MNETNQDELTELLVKYVEENQTRKILEIIEESETKEEIRDKVKTLLKK